MIITAVLALWCGLTLWLRQRYRQGRLVRDYHCDLAALLALALATLAFFWPLYLRPNTWVPVGGGDLVSFLYPMYRFIARSLAAVDLPLWNPYLYGGAPFAADNQSALFYPPNLLLLVLQPDIQYRTVEIYATLQFFLAGSGTYIGLRFIERRPLCRLAALAGALTFMFSDLFVTHLGNLNMIAVAAWLPLAFFSFRRALDERRCNWALAAGAFLGLAALGGHIQPLLHMALALSLYWLWDAVVHWRAGPRRLARSVAVLSLVALVAFGLAAPTLLPGYEMSQWSIRTDLSYAQASEYSLPPQALAGLLVPAYYGRGPRGFWGPWPRVEVGYVGIVPLLLAGVAMLLRRDRLTSYAVILAVVATLLALGNHAPLHARFYRWVPGMNLVRAPARFIYLLDFGLALLAALGLDILLDQQTAKPARAGRALSLLTPGAMVAIIVAATLAVRSAAQEGIAGDAETAAHMAARGQGILFATSVALTAILVAYLGVRLRMRRTLLAIVACGLIFFDLYAQGAHTELEMNDPTTGFRHEAAAAFIQSDPDMFRIDTRTGISNVWQPDLSLVAGLADVSGIYNPLVLADWDRYWEGLGSRSTPLYDFLNVKYLIGHKDVVLDWNKFELAFDGDPQVNVYRNTHVLPRALIVHDAIVVDSHEQAFATIQQEGFDPATTAVVEQGRALADASPTPSSSAQIVSYSNDEIVIAATVNAPGYLVLSEVYYPGWYATVDGQSVPIQRANYAFRAVELAPGTHRIRVFFRPPLWVAGMSLCAVTVTGLLVVTVWSVFGKRHNRQA